MSNIALVTFAAKTVTPQDDALVYESALGSGGIIYGAEVTVKNANTLHINTGHGVICGRKFTVFDSDIPVGLSSSGTILGRLYIHLDLSNAFDPIELLVETGQSLSPLEQDENVNITNGVYDINIATFEVSTSTIQNLRNVYPKVAYANSGSLLKITTQEASLLGQEVSVTDGTDYVYAVFDAEGVAELKNVLMTGTLTLTATDGNETANASITVPYYGSYEVELSFWNATIQVTTPSTEFYGQTVTIKNSSNVVVGTTTFSNLGVAEYIVKEPDTYTVSVTLGGETTEASVEVTTQTTYTVELKNYTLYGFSVDSTKATDNVSYNVQYGTKDVANKNYSSGYMDFSNDKWVWGNWTGDEFFMPRPVLISQDYSDKIYLNPDDLTKDVDGNDVSAKLTGSTDGYNAMMEWGRDGRKIWYKLVPNESDDASYTCYVCDKQLDSGFKAWPFYDQNNNLGDHFYTSIYNGSTVGSALRSLSGKTPNNTEAGATQITRAKANNKNNETYAWYIDVFADRILINLLLILVTKSTNSDVVGYGNYTGGSSASSLIQTGLGNTKGMFYGKQSNGVVKVFGMENYFANCWRRMAGLILNGGVQLYKLTYGTADGSGASGYREDDNAPSNYLTGKSIATNLSSSYIIKESAKADGSLLASAFGGQNAQYYSDACWSSTGVKYAHVGGGCGSGSACGAFTLDLSTALSASAWYIGASLSLKPLAQ